MLHCLIPETLVIIFTNSVVAIKIALNISECHTTDMVDKHEGYKSYMITITRR